MEIVKDSRESLANQVQSVPADIENTGTGGQQGMNFRPLLRTVRRNSWLILGVTALTTGLAYLISSSTAPVYQGNLRLLVEPVTPERGLSDPGVVARGQDTPRKTAELDYSTQLVILQSSGLLADIVKQVQANDPDFNEGVLRQGLTIKRCCTGDALAGIGAESTKIISKKRTKNIFYVWFRTCRKYTHKFSQNSR